VRSAAGTVDHDQPPTEAAAPFFFLEVHALSEVGQIVESLESLACDCSKSESVASQQLLTDRSMTANTSPGRAPWRFYG
jgi:hypothetical protein